MSADIVDLGFRVNTTDIDRATQKFSLLDREFGKVERSGGLVARSFESVGESGKKSGGLVSRAFREASQEIDRAMRSAVGLAASLMNLRRNLTDTDMRIRVSLDNAQAIADLAALRNTPDVSVRINVSANVSGAVAALQAVNALARDRDISIRVNAVGSAGAAASINTLQRAIAELNASLLVGIQLLNDYSDSLDRVRRAANDAADAIRRAADEQERLRRAGGGFGGGNSETGWRRHARSVLDTANAYSGLAVRLLAAKSAIAVLTAAAAGAIPVLGQMAAAAGAVFGTALATANVAAMSKELSKLTETTGASADGLQKWRLAARFEGVDAALNEFGDMAGVFTDLSSQMDKLGTESGKDFAEGLKLIGLSAKQIKEMKPEEALLAIGDAIAKSNMSTRDKTAFLGAISDDAAKLLPLLEKAGQKFNEISGYASKVGAIQSDAQLAAAKEANTQLSYFKVGLEGVQTQLAAVGNRMINTLGPNIKKLFVDAKTPLDEWALSVDIVLTKFKHDLDSTGSWGTAFARMFEGMYPTLYQFIGSAGKFGKGYGEAFIAPMLDALKRGYAGISESLGNAGGAESLGKGLGEAMLPVITIVDTIVASIKLLINNWDALKAVAAVTPVGLIAANWDSVVAVFELVGNGIRGVGEAFGLLNPATTANASGVQIFVAALGALLVSGAASRLVLGAIGATFSTLSFALAPLGAALGIVATGLKAVALAAMANPIGALITVIAMGAALIFTNWSKVGEFFTGLWAGVKSSFSGLIDWWNNTTPKQKVLDIKAATIDVAREKYTQFVSWLDNTTPKQKIIDIATGSVSIAQKAVDLFIARWNESLIRSWALDVKTSALDYAEQKASDFSAWWDSWTLEQVVADVSAEVLIFAWGKSQQFASWWDSWNLKEIALTASSAILEKAFDVAKTLGGWWDEWKLLTKDLKADASLVEKAEVIARKFADWWNNLSLKSIIPDIKMPDIAGFGAKLGAKMRSIGSDVIDGLAQGMDRASSHMKAAEQAANKIPLVLRSALDTHSPSKVTEKIGFDVVAGLAVGIAGNNGAVNAAANLSLAVTNEFSRMADDINRSLTDAFMSLDVGKIGSSLVGMFKQHVVQPILSSVLDPISKSLAGGFSSITKSFLGSNFGNALGGVGNSIGGLFSGIASSAANGFAGIGTAISGGLSGIMGSFGTLVSAIPGWGWALAGVAGLAKLFGGPSAPKINLTQGAKAGQGMLTDGQQHYTKTALGTVGATDASYKIGREKGFVPKLHEWFKWVESFDAMIAKTLPNSITSISEALKGVEMKGANLEGFTRQRLHTIFSALPEALQVAIQGGKNIMAGTTEEIAARFTYMAQVAESGLIPALEQLGLAGTQSKESMIAFAMSLADTMGGIDAAKAALDNYYQTAYTEAERLAMTQSAAKAKLDEYNKSLGLSGTQYIDTIAELRAYIDAQDKNTEAGRKAIASALGMVDALKTLGGTAEEAAKKLADNTAAFRDAAYTDAQKQQMTQNEARKSIDVFNASLGLTGAKTIDNIIELKRYINGLDASTEAGRKARESALSMTSAFVAFGGTAEQIKQKIAGLKEGIKGLVGDLYGKTTTTTNTSTTAAQSALDAANSTLDSLRSRYDDEKERIAAINEQAREAYNDQLDYYRTLRDAMQSLLDLANGFADDSRAASDTLKAAQLGYNATLRAAQGGDVEAAKKLGDAANRLKISLGAAYNNDDRAASAIQQIEQQLRATAGTLGSLAGTEPNDPGTISSTLIASLQSQISAQESLVSSLQSQISSTNAAANEAKATADRAAMAKELATKIGELGLATDKSAWDILAKNGINIKDLAKDFGINVNQLDVNFAKKVGELSGLLNVNSLQLLSKLGVSVTDLASAYGINTDKLNAGMVNKIGELASTLNVNSFELLKKLGITTQELAAAYGLNTNNLNQTFLTKLDSLSDILRVSTVDMASKLGVNIDKLGDLMANKLASLPNIPADIKAGLAPHLQDIRNAADPATLQRELKELQAYVNSLPPGIKEKLQGQLDGILGYTGDTKTNTADTKTETLALRSIRSSVDNTSAHTADLTAYTRDQVNAKGIQLALQNSRALNQHAAKIGKESIPSFAVGHPNLPSDMLANVHKGEMILTAAQAGDARDLVLHNQRVIPMISGYLSSIAERVAANDNQAPVFIQPLYMPTINHQQRQTDSKKDEDNEALRVEIKELRKAVETLIPYQSAIANNTRKSAATLDKWDTDGQPEERVA